MSKKITLGEQITASFEYCTGDVLRDCDRLLGLLRQVVELLGFEEVSHHCHPFSPHGITCVLVLAQSHLIAHTWPEYQGFVIDIFACGEIQFDLAEEFIKKTVKAKSVILEKRLREIHWKDEMME
ncbi:adenosylmethionine decarboxylase [candidate division KSB3 bacterium]|uniref:Adenosylmethionine decarboxylase n=1 Tax=candidate division KSB3 bacterium TaxID=2044937 RepID=A0A2G6KAM8_9BACT|nr:MAG: adenosylmethionine decarboxylase [candidate division KSB3 bacterium]